MENILFTTPGISCSHCEMTITKAVKELTGTGTVNVDLSKKTVSVEYDSSVVTTAAIKEAIENQGYDVE